MQTRANIDNRMADTAYGQGLLKYEPWKLMVSAITASAVIFGVIGGILGYMLRGTH